MPPRFFSIRITCGFERKDEIEYFLKSRFADYWFQLEVGKEAGKEHFQCHVYAKKPMALKTVINAVRRALPSDDDEKGLDCNVSAVSADRAMAIQRYVTKFDTRVEGPWSSKPIYLGQDLACIEKSPYQFQKDIIEMIKKKADDRKIVYYYNDKGNIGKSKLTKYLCFHRLAKSIKVTSADRLASAICKAGAFKAYIIDIPRSVDPTKSLKAVFEVIEALKNGHVVDNFYGHDNELFMNSPHVIVFSNHKANTSLCSLDRWDIRTLASTRVCPI